MTSTPTPIRLPRARGYAVSTLVRTLCGVVPLALALWSPLAFAADAAQVVGAQVAVSDGVTAVAIQLQPGGGTPTVSPFRQTNPERIVIDIAGATLAPGTAGPRGGIITNSEVTTFNDGQDNVRLTLYVSRTATWSVSAAPNVIVIALKAGEAVDPLGSALAEAPAPSAGSGGATPTGLDTVGGVKLSGPDVPVGGPSLTTLDFQQKDRVSRVLLGAQNTEPSITQPERDLIVIDLPGAFVPESLRREVDTRFFYSAVDSLRAYPTRAGGRVAVRLREGAEYNVKRENGLLVLEISVPSNLVAARDAALQRPSEAAPSTPSTDGTGTISNSTGSEVLITDTGRSVDPGATLGNGGGTRAPGRFAFAQDVTNSQSAGATYTGRKMSIDLQEADIHTVFRFIADFGDVNIVTSDDVKGNVTVRLKDVPWDEALASILQAKGLGAQQLGRVVRVAPLETIKSEQVAALEASKAQDQLEKLSLYVAPLNYSSADDVKAQIASVLSDRGSVEVDSRSNQLIIQDSAEQIAQARELIRSLDRPNRQVSIEARFVEANSTFTSSLGVQWGGEMNASAATGFPTGTYFPSSIGAIGGLPVPATGGAGGGNRGPVFYSAGADNLLVDLGANAPTSGLSFALGSISGLFDINARLSAAVAEGWGKIVSSPRVTALDNEEAVVSQGARIPYQTTSQNGTQTQFINALLELRVTPHITTGGTIFLDLEIRNDRPDFSFQTSATLPPGISTKSVETRILVPDGDTAVLGGVYSTSETFASSRVPGLGDIPVLGYLFKNSNRTRTQNEMLVFITPRIVPVDGGGNVATK